MEAQGRYRIEATTAPDGHTLTAYDMAGLPHAALTAFARSMVAEGQPAAARAYTYALLDFFAFLDTTPAQRGGAGIVRRARSTSRCVPTCPATPRGGPCSWPRCAGSTGCSMPSGPTIIRNPSPGTVR